MNLPIISKKEVKKLKNVEVKVRKGKKTLNAYTATNDQFIRWVAKRMKAAYSEHRLMFRIELLRLVRKVL